MTVSPGLRILIGIALAGAAPIAASAQEDVAPVARQAADDSYTIVETPLVSEDRLHWAFRPVSVQAVPEVRHTAWPRGPIDRFLLARLERASLEPTVVADRETLLRRLTFDLIGLPPTLDELDTFLADSAPDAFERQVDRLLASPHYGQRWAQHWLDLARFAETDGFEHDKVRATAWTYRDWVIAALNANLPYDRFVLLQVAGDLTPDADGATATMFCLSGPDMPDINDQSERRHLMLNEMTSTVGAVFLGLQMGCAECHDHKYDPISQSDFYRLRAAFESAVPELKRDVPLLRLAEQPEVIPARFWIRGDARRPGPRVDVAFPRIASQDDAGDRPIENQPARLALARWLVRADNPLTARVMANRVWKHHFGRGLFETPSDVGLLNAEPTHPELLDWLSRSFVSTGWNLKQLHRQNVTSAAYRLSSRPTEADPAWLARRRTDPRNEWFGRANRRRLDGESLRDALLQVSGLLNDEPGGPGVRPPLPTELTATLLKGQWTPSPRLADHDRRSIGLFARRNLRYPVFEAFDRPDGNGSCAVRGQSTTPLQSLLMLNSELTLRVARHLAKELLLGSEDPRQQVNILYRRAFSRSATSAEIERVVRFLNAETARLQVESLPPEGRAVPPGQPAGSARGAALVEACLAILNSSELLTVD